MFLIQKKLMQTNHIQASIPVTVAPYLEAGAGCEGSCCPTRRTDPGTSSAWPGASGPRGPAPAGI